MTHNMLDMAGQAILILAEPERIAFLVLGVLLGLLVGVIPGLGGLIGLSLLLPFTFSMDPFSGLALMMGLVAVTTTSDTIPAVLFGVPGTVGSAATVLDGHPMARKGEASRAFGAAFFASVVGGLFGAVLLGLSVPVLRPIMFMIGTPDLLAICLLGLSLVATLSSGAALKGLTVACLGLLIATTGEDLQTGTERWTFGGVYLLDGYPIVPVALGLFALPELAELAVTRARIASTNATANATSQLAGVRDVVRNWFLVLRCSFIGAGLGAIPGLGASVIDWIAYGHAARTERGAKESFGSGDVRGVIASESSNNAKEGGALVPTIAFGVPGSASMALLLGAFLIQGIVPGPAMLDEHLDVTYALVWSVAFANIIGAGLCFAFAGQLAKIARVRTTILVPVVLAFTFLGAFQGSRSWEDLYVLLGFGLLGWFMKVKGWPRPPLVLGIVLGGLIENYMFISIDIYGASWLLRPVVIVILAFALLGILGPIFLRLRNRPSRRQVSFEWRGLAPDADKLLALSLVALFATATIVAQAWPAAAKLIPTIISTAGLVFSFAALICLLVRVRFGDGDTVESEPARFDLKADVDHLSRREMIARASTYFGACFGYMLLSWGIGLIPALPFFVAGFMRFVGGERWRAALVSAGLVTALCYVLFHLVLLVPWPPTLVGSYFPELRSLRSLALF